jgi:hypothetical protein
MLNAAVEQNIQLIIYNNCMLMMLHRTQAFTMPAIFCGSFKGFVYLAR